VSRSESDLLEDIANTITAIRSHLRHGPLSQGLVMDAVAMRLLEIGEAVKSLGDDATQAEPGIKWRQISGMRDVLAHHYFATDPGFTLRTYTHLMEGSSGRTKRAIDTVFGAPALQRPQAPAEEPE